MLKLKVIRILYASQTGNSEYIAKNIFSESKIKGFSVEYCKVMDDFLFEKEDKIQIIIFVSSSTGDGDPPDNALKFWRNFRKIKDNDIFQDIKFTVLGLGDTNYSNFGAHPKKIEKKMKEKGASVFYNCGLADEVETLEVTVDPWVSGLWKALEQDFLPVLNKDLSENLVSELKSVDLKDDVVKTVSPIFPSLPYEMLKDREMSLTGLARTPEPCFIIEWSTNLVSSSKRIFDVGSHGGNGGEEYTKDRPFMAKYKSSRILTRCDSVKKKYHFEIDITGMNWSYSPGDAVGIVCDNDEELVRSIISRLNLNADAEFILKPHNDNSPLPLHIKTPCSVYCAFKYYLDITTFPRKNFFKLMADVSKDLIQKKMLLYLCSREGATEYKNLGMMYPNLLDLLNHFTASTPSLDLLFSTLLPLHPRYFSIACSPLVHPEQLNFAFSVLRYNVSYSLEERHGICTSWLEKIGLAQGTEDDEVLIPIFPKVSKDFILPEDVNLPLICIGPGTGVSPFIGFCQHRAKLGIKSPFYLYYGCRNKEKDFIYQDEITKFVEDGIITEFHVSYSRNEEGGAKYVQDNLKLNSEKIFNTMIKDGGVLYVCGDAKGMSKDVNDCLLEILIGGGLSQKEARDCIVEWINSRRYNRDVWA